MLEHWRGSLSARLLCAYALAWFVTVAVLAGAATWALDHSDFQAHSAGHAADALARHLQRGEGGEPVMPPLPESLQWCFDALPQDCAWRVLDARGHVLRASSPAARDGWRAGNVPAHGATRTLPGGEGWQLEVSLSNRLVALRHDELGRTFGATLALTALLAVALLGAVLLLALRHLLAPLQRVSREAATIHPRGPWQRLGTEGLPREIAPLVTSFNDTLARLEQAFERQQHFLADAAHELKTPLALMRAQLELGDDDRTLLLQEIDHMSRQVQQLLMLAEVSEPHSYHSEAIDVPAVVRDVAGFLRPLASRHGVALLTETEATTVQPGDRSALFVLLKNLVENAIKVAPAGSTVTLEVSADAVRVRDRGPGIAPEHLPRLFDRFWRAPRQRSAGAGLGLAICLEVATAHGWQLAARNAEPGAEFTLGFPTAAPTP